MEGKEFVFVPISPPKPAGWWVLPGSMPGYRTAFSAQNKPRWLTRKMMNWIFEWKWEAEL